MLSMLPDFLSFFRIQFLYMFLWGKLEKNVTATDRISLRGKNLFKMNTDWLETNQYVQLTSVSGYV